MRELSLHILDIVQNSISAGAAVIEIVINEDIERDLFGVDIIDNGCGIEESALETITDPFVTSRKTREVGLGLPLFKEAARQCNGDLEIKSVVGEGTKVRAYFQHSHIDRAPLGDIKETLLSLISVNPDIDFIYWHKFKDEEQDKEFIFSTIEVKDELDGLSINNPKVLKWLEGYIKEGLKNLYGGDL
ncbi:MAG: ATP-binding protein [Halanaerobiales bacterium]